MPTKETLHQLVDAMPEEARQAIESLAHPFVLALATAPIDDEPETEEARAAVVEAYEDLAHGRVRPWEEVRRELAGD